MQNPGSIRHRKPSEDGYLLLSVMIMLTLLTIWMTLAVPQVIQSIQRDRDLETMNRGKQYIRAIQLYYRKFHAYPPSIDALVNTNSVRFLRKRYVDPITGKDDWKPIYFGQNKAPLVMGFFGQPLGGVNGATPIAGTGPSGSGGTGSNPTGSTFGSSFGSSSGPGSGSTFGSSFGGGSGSSLSGNSLFGSSNSGSTTTGANTNGSSTTGGATDNSGNSTGGATGSTGSTGSGFMSGQTGQSFGGGGIIGVEPASTKQSILVYKKMNHYNQWEFTYSPLMEMKQQAGGSAGIGQPVGAGVNGTGTSGAGTSGSGTSGAGTSSLFGGSSNTFGGSSNTFGGSGSLGSSPSPTQPQQ